MDKGLSWSLLSSVLASFSGRRSPSGKPEAWSSGAALHPTPTLSSGHGTEVRGTGAWTRPAAGQSATRKETDSSHLFPGMSGIWGRRQRPSLQLTPSPSHLQSGVAPLLPRCPGQSPRRVCRTELEKAPGTTQALLPLLLTMALSIEACGSAGQVRGLLEPRSPAEGTGSTEAFSSELFGARKSLITYICFYGNFWETRRGRKYKQPVADGEGPRCPPRPHGAGPRSVAGVIK